MPSTDRLTATEGGPAARPHPAAHSERRIRSFHPRRGRITTGQADALARHWASWGIDIDGTRLDLPALFGAEYEDIVLEIGFGMGDATAEMAAADPATGILAADVHTPGQGNLLALAEKRKLTNIRLANGDAVILLRDMLAPESLAGIRIFFPDPWPKARHHKRRLIQPEFTALAASRLRPGATFHCATDWEPYAEQMLAVLSSDPALENAYEGHGGTGYADTDPRPAHRPTTKFEQQGAAKGHVVHDLLFRRR